MRDGTDRTSTRSRSRWDGRAGRATLLTTITAVAALAAGCTSATTGGPITVTSTIHSSVPSTGAGQPAPGGSTTGPGAPSVSPSAPGDASSPPSGGAAPTGASGTNPPSSQPGSRTTAGGDGTSTASGGTVEPDGFKLTKLQPGQQPPQFIAVGFDGAGWHEKWQYYAGIAAQVPFHFTANLTGLYLLDAAHKDAYRGTGHPRGASALGSWNTPAEVAQEVEDLNKAYADGNEIATHFMGHFCDPGASPGADSWDTAAWNNDLDQFFDVWRNYRSIDQIPGLPALDVPADEVVGERTPCLQGSPDALFPALVKHGMTYDESFTRRGIVWPTKSPQYHIWTMGMAEFPMHGITPGHGAGHVQITMDYNFWYSQEYDPATGQMKQTSAAQSKEDSQQVQATYQDMLDGALAGSHAPLLLGNHFNDWNNNAYTEALGNFLLANCGRTGVYCVPYRDVVDWMEYQDPSVLAALQAKPPVLGPPAG